MKIPLCFLGLFAFACSVSAQFVGDYIAIIEPSRCAYIPNRQVAYLNMGPDGWGSGEVLDFQGNHLAWVRANVVGRKFTALSVGTENGWDFTGEFLVKGSINLRTGKVSARASTTISPGVTCRSIVTAWRETRY